jgi:signal transduction histidine kinase
MRPLDRLPSIKLKLGVIVVVAVAGTTLAIVGGIEVGLNWLLAGALAVAAGLLAIQLLARGMTSPLRQMVSATRAMARGDYEQRVTATSRDEVGELARAFNKMAGELAEVDRMRRDLVANVSHDLRTPISALRASLENVVDGVASADGPMLETMLAQVQRLSRLVDQLLDLSKLESGAIPLRVSRFELRPLLEQTVKEAEIGTEARARELRFDLKVEPVDLVASGDPERIEQLVSNLVENAVAHSPDGGKVAISAESRGADLALEIADEGHGIPPAERTKVFERFYRADASRSNDGGGSGLGLAICRWIVDLHQGDIAIGDNSPRGCRMTVTLPAGAR